MGPPRAWLERRLPALLRLYRAARRSLRDRLVPPVAVFSDIHSRAAWGGEESRSGPGSSLAATARLRRVLPALLRELRVRSLLDAGCGDYHWMQETDLGEVEYIGVDVVPDLIRRNQDGFAGPHRRFLVGDVTRDPLPRADIILCRDCLIHLSNRHVIAALRNLKASGARYLLANTYPRVTDNADIATGAFRPINLERSPFDLPAPLRWVDDARRDEGAGDADPQNYMRLGLWELDPAAGVHDNALRTGP